MEWIKTSTQLPENYKEVLAYSTTRESIMVLHYNDGSFEDEECIDHDVSHWMPLPNKPNKCL